MYYFLFVGFSLTVQPQTFSLHYVTRCAVMSFKNSTNFHIRVKTTLDHSVQLFLSENQQKTRKHHPLLYRRSDSFATVGCMPRANTWHGLSFCSELFNPTPGTTGSGGRGRGAGEGAGLEKEVKRPRRSAVHSGTPFPRRDRAPAIILFRMIGKRGRKKGKRFGGGSAHDPPGVRERPHVLVRIHPGFLQPLAVCSPVSACSLLGDLSCREHLSPRAYPHEVHELFGRQLHGHLYSPSSAFTLSMSRSQLMPYELVSACRQAMNPSWKPSS